MYKILTFSEVLIKLVPIICDGDESRERVSDEDVERDSNEDLERDFDDDLERDLDEDLERECEDDPERERDDSDDSYSIYRLKHDLTLIVQIVKTF